MGLIGAVNIGRNRVTAAAIVELHFLMSFKQRPFLLLVVCDRATVMFFC